MVVLFTTILTLIQNTVNIAAHIPIDCRISVKSLAMGGLILNAKVITGKATEPPPSLVKPVEEM